jgi:GT2 family glycosyltransferase
MGLIRSAAIPSRDRARRKGDSGITLIVPFTPGLNDERDRIWKWLNEYWERQLPRVRIVIGQDPVHGLAQEGVPFSKTAAVNAAAAQAHGDILVILDADAYVSPDLITYCASEIRYARRTDRRLWFVPYRRFYRLSKDATERVLNSDPQSPWHPDDPPLSTHLDPLLGRSPQYGHHFAAMIMIMPREAFEDVGGMDPRFAGWGGEDVSAMRAIDTIYSPHKTVDYSVFHLYHGTIGAGVNRQWQGQTKRMPYARLGSRYLAAYGNRERMLRLNREWREAL